MMTLISDLCGLFAILVLSFLPPICTGQTLSLPGSDADPSAITRDLVVDPIVPIVTIEVDSTEKAIAEGDLGMFRILRNASVGDLRVNPLIEGNAMYAGR